MTIGLPFDLILSTGPLRTVMFYIIGLGLSDEKDVTVRGLEVRI